MPFRIHRRLFLHRIVILDWLPQLFERVFTTSSVIAELEAGFAAGLDGPRRDAYPWLETENPTAIPPEWLALELGDGELSAMALARERFASVVLLDDLLARRTAQAAGLTVWGTLKLLLEGKSKGFTARVEPLLQKLSSSGMWLSPEIITRVLKLAGE